MLCEFLFSASFAVSACMVRSLYDVRIPVQRQYPNDMWNMRYIIILRIFRSRGVMWRMLNEWLMTSEERNYRKLTSRRITVFTTLPVRSRMNSQISIRNSIEVIERFYLFAPKCEICLKFLHTTRNATAFNPFVISIFNPTMHNRRLFNICSSCRSSIELFGIHWTRQPHPNSTVVRIVNWIVENYHILMKFVICCMRINGLDECCMFWGRHIVE